MSAAPYGHLTSRHRRGEALLACLPVAGVGIEAQHALDDGDDERAVEQGERQLDIFVNLAKLDPPHGKVAGEQDDSGEADEPDKAP